MGRATQQKARTENCAVALFFCSFWPPDRMPCNVQRVSSEGLQVAPKCRHRPMRQCRRGVWSRPDGCGLCLAPREPYVAQCLISCFCFSFCSCRPGGPRRSGTRHKRSVSQSKLFKQRHIRIGQATAAAVCSRSAGQCGIRGKKVS